MSHTPTPFEMSRIIDGGHIKWVDVHFRPQGA